MIRKFERLIYYGNDDDKMLSDVKIFIIWDLIMW